MPDPGGHGHDVKRTRLRGEIDDQGVPDRRADQSDVPEGTRELVLLCFDPDAPRGTFLHWLVTGIDPSATGYDPASPVGTEHENGFGEQGYGGPQPPVGDDAHRYVFRLYALPEPFAAPGDADADTLRSWLDAHALSTGTLIGRYQR